MFSRRWAAPVAAVLCLVAAACGGGSNDDDGSQGSDEPQTGGSLTYSFYIPATSLDVIAAPEYFNNTSDASRTFAIYDALMVADPDTGEVEPRLAESLETNDGGATYTLTLREGVQFSDGTPFDAEAVKFNWERLQNPENSAPTAQYANMTSNFEVVDERTLQFSVSPATPRFAVIVARYLTAIGSPTAIQELGEGFGEKPVGAGPFVVSEFVRDSHIALARNENYWQEGRPYLDELRLQFIADEQQRLQALTTGDIDMAQTASTQTLARAEGSGLAEFVWVTGAGRWLALNANEAPFDNPIAVEAIRVAVDREAYITNAEGERGIVAETFLRDDHPLFDEAGIFPEYDPDKAQDLLDQYAAEAGDPLSFTITVPEATRSAGETLQSLLTVYDNIDIGIEVLPTSEYLTRIGNWEYESYVGATNFVDPFPQLHNQLHSQSPANSSSMNIPELDAALDDAAKAESDEDRKAAYVRVQEILAKDSSMIILSRPQNAILYNDDRVRNVEFFNDNAPFWDEIWVTD